MVTTAVCVLLIALVCGAILYEGYAAGDDDPAHVEVAVDAAQAEQRDGLWYVPFRVANHGDETIEEIWVVVEGADGSGQTVVESETTVALLGESEEAHAMAVFEADPRELELKGRVRSFQIAEDV
jgi:uncharacterized protein (TIGR02588 family)